MIHAPLCLVLAPWFVAAPLSMSGPYYNGDDLPPNAPKFQDEQLTGTVDLNLKKFNVAAVKKGGAAVATAALSRAERIALYFAFGSAPGGELDMLVEDAGKLTPVEVTWDGDTLNVKAGEPRATIYGTAAPKEDIQKKFGVGPFVDSGSKWDNDSLFVVETALSKLSPAELKGIAGLPFHRMPRDPSAKRVRGTAIAMYVPDKGQIELYDYALEADKRKFYGSVDAPLPLSVGTVIHEAGHAIARASTRGLRKQAEETKKEYDDINAKIMAEKKQYDADKAEYQRSKDPALGKALNEKSAALKPLLDEMAKKKRQFEEVAGKMVMADRQGSPLEQSFDKTLPFRSAPTMYGRTAIGESFAECFALFKVDRPALERAAPAAIKWFQSKEYQAFVAD